MASTGTSVIGLLGEVILVGSIVMKTAVLLCHVLSSAALKAGASEGWCGVHTLSLVRQLHLHFQAWRLAQQASIPQQSRRLAKDRNSPVTGEVPSFSHQGGITELLGLIKLL